MLTKQLIHTSDIYFRIIQKGGNSGAVLDYLDEAETVYQDYEEVSG